MINFPGFPKPRFLNRDGLKLALYEAGPQDGYPIILTHGWPELAYSWKTQITPLVAHGFRVIAHDVRGFGNSYAPKGVAHYGIAQLVGDIEAILDDIGAETAILCGHDWGGIMVWHAARMLSERISHVISVCTPHVRRAPADPIEIFRKRHGDEHYFVHFTDRPGEADALFARDPDAFFRLMFRTTPTSAKLTSQSFHIPARFQAFLDAGTPEVAGMILDEDDRSAYAKAYTQSGFHGGLNLYRNTTTNWRLAQGLSDQITQPSLMISAERDLFLPPESTDAMPDMVPHLTRHIIADCGHWVMWEQPEVLSALILDWILHHI